MAECDVLQHNETVYIRMEPGEEMFASLRECAMKGGWRELWVINGVGSVRELVLVYPKNVALPPKIERVRIKGPLEIGSLSGTVRVEESGYHVHLHGAFFRKAENGYGGAVGEETVIFKGAELFCLARGD